MEVFELPQIRRIIRVPQKDGEFGELRQVSHCIKDLGILNRVGCLLSLWKSCVNLLEEKELSASLTVKMFSQNLLNFLSLLSEFIFFSLLCKMLEFTSDSLELVRNQKYSF